MHCCMSEPFAVCCARDILPVGNFSARSSNLIGKHSFCIAFAIKLRFANDRQNEFLVLVVVAFRFRLFCFRLFFSKSVDLKTHQKTSYREKCCKCCMFCRFESSFFLSTYFFCWCFWFLSIGFSYLLLGAFPFSGRVGWCVRGKKSKPDEKNVQSRLGIEIM